jgi:hypothetical protein
MNVKELQKLMVNKTSRRHTDIIIRYKESSKTNAKTKYEYALFGNSNSLWMSRNYDVNPPFVNTIPYESVEEIYTKEKNPEYFL